MNQYEKDAAVFRAFCDPNRLRVLELLRSGEKCACVLLSELNISQSTLSHHMKILCESGIVKGRREGKWTHYSLSEAGSQAAAELLQRLTRIEPSPVIKDMSYGGDRDMENEKTKLYVLTGFLGSGKTTVLLRLLEALKGKRVGVI